ncbi:MAG: hypothetical protein WA114_10480 [Psychrobacter glacincola]
MCEKPDPLLPADDFDKHKMDDSAVLIRFQTFRLATAVTESYYS